MPTNFCPKKDGSVEWNFIEFRASPTVDDRMQGMETNSNTFFSGERMNTKMLNRLSPIIAAKVFWVGSMAASWLLCSR